MSKYIAFAAIACGPLIILGLAWLAWEARRILRPEFDEYNRYHDQAELRREGRIS